MSWRASLDDAWQHEEARKEAARRLCAETEQWCEAEKMRLLNIAENHTRIFVSTANLSGPMDKEARKNHALYGSIASAQANMLSSQKFTTVDDAKRALASLEKEFKK